MAGRLPIDVMISSTSKDLPEHRRQATDAVLRSNMSPWGMETLSASTGDAISESLDMVDKSEIYIGIIGMRYGHIPVDPVRNCDNISITEMEYRRALKREIPILIYIMDKDHPVPERRAGEEDTFFEPTEMGKEKLKKLKDEMGTRHVVGFFKSPEELRALIVQSLNDPRVIEKAMAKVGELDKSKPPISDIGIPLAPALYSVPPYTLTSNFIGRVAELAMLDEWAKGDTPVMVIEAIGGMGKSALTWEWVNRQAAKPDHGYDGIFWYSFYEGGAQMSDFMRHALAYITHRKPDSLKNMAYDELKLELLPELQSGHYLFVMDGLERVLVAYHRIDASQVRDDQVENNLRACISHKDTLFVEKLAALTRSKMLISTRLMPDSLEDAGDPIKGVQRRALKGLHPYDAFNLMKDRGVTWDNEPELDKFMAQIGYHGLLLKIIAGRIKEHRRARGHYDTWYEQDGRHLTLSQLTEDKRRTNVLKYAFDGLDETKRKLLSQIAAFSDSVDYDTVAVFNPYVQQPPQEVESPQDYILTDYEERIQNTNSEVERKWLMRQLELRKVEIAPHIEAYEAYLQAQAEYDAYKNSSLYRAALATFDMALAELEDRGLLQWDRDNDTYDLHPVVRGYSFDRLEDRERTFGIIHDHFQQRSTDIYETAQTLADLRTSLEIYRALVGAGRLHEAYFFSRDRLIIILVFRISAYHKALELLKPLFVNEDFAQLPKMAGYSIDILESTLSALIELGQINEAQQQAVIAMKLSMDEGLVSSLTVNISNYSICEFRLNHLARSLRTSKLEGELAIADDNWSYKTMYQGDLLQIYTVCGQWQEAKAAYTAFKHESIPPIGIYAPGFVERYYAWLQFYMGENPHQTIEKGLETAVSQRIFDEQMHLLALRARVCLSVGKLSDAEKAVDEALAVSARSGSASQSAYIALLAEIVSARSNHYEAKRHIIDVLKMTAFEVDKAAIYNAAAIVYHAAGDDERAGDYVKTAYKYAWADGEPYSNWYELKRAREMLKTLGIEEPKLPPFDPSKVEKIPYEDEIRALIEELKAKKQRQEDDSGEED